MNRKSDTFHSFFLWEHSAHRTPVRGRPQGDSSCPAKRAARAKLGAPIGGHS